MSIVYFAVLAVVIALGSAAETNPKSRLTRKGINIQPDPGAALIISVVLILVSGLRYRVGTDFMAYYRNRVTDLNVVWRSLITFKEPGIKLLSFLSHGIYDDGQSLIFLSALITIGLFCLTIYRNSSMYLIGMLLYLFLGDWQGSFNGVRQYLAAAILFAGHRYIFYRDFPRYLAVVLLAALFHTSAVVMIVPYFFLTRKPDITQLVILLIGTIILSFSYGLIFRFIGETKGTIMNTSDPYVSNNVKLPRILVAFIPVAIYIFLSKKERNTAEQEFYINAMIFNAFAMLASMGSTYLARIGIYTGSMLPIGYGYLFQTIQDEKTKKLTLFGVLSIYLFYWIYSLQTWSLNPFHWIFERSL